jgi:hypothetical protein
MPKAQTTMTDYDKPAKIEAPAPYVDNGQGGNANAGQYVTVRKPYVGLYSGNFGRGLHRAYQYGQLYPEASQWGEMRYSTTVTDDTMILVVYGRRFQILGAIDHNLAHKIIVLALVEYQAKGTRHV